MPKKQKWRSAYFARIALVYYGHIKHKKKKKINALQNIFLSKKICLFSKLDTLLKKIPHFFTKSQNKRHVKCISNATRRVLERHRFAQIVLLIKQWYFFFYQNSSIDVKRLLKEYFDSRKRNPTNCKQHLLIYLYARLRIILLVFFWMFWARLLRIKFRI